jgi:hypothetical protein
LRAVALEEAVQSVPLAGGQLARCNVGKLGQNIIEYFGLSGVEPSQFRGRKQSVLQGGHAACSLGERVEKATDNKCSKWVPQRSPM